ncbi:hypothetical protein SAMN05444172_9174 [Burkholderia sp. GAS332]|nr:hypothetical protein SAMN05444172_9174 [Burkholderia sp. GAS332]
MTRKQSTGGASDPQTSRETVHRLPFREPRNSGDGMAAQPNRCCGTGSCELVHPMARSMVVMVIMADFMAVMLVGLSA